jgi:hypothetical protein
MILTAIVSCLSLLAFSGHAIQFSADAVMSSPGRADVSTHLYYSPGRIRKEFYYYGEPVIQILDAEKQISLMCFTQQQVCYENKSVEAINIGIENSVQTPCKAGDGVSCENQGEEKLNNRTAIKWEITTQQGDQKVVSSLWLDKELGIPVKQTLSNGAAVDLTWLGSEPLGNRDTEKWLQKISLPDGQVQQSYQWFDKELKISIREAFDNGNSQELKHIVVEKLSDKLFTIPLGFEKKAVVEKTTTKPAN